MYQCSPTRRVNEQWCEALHPSDGELIDLDSTLGEELLDIAVRQVEPQIAMHREHDHFRWEPKPGERRIGTGCTATRVPRNWWTIRSATKSFYASRPITP